MVRYTALIIGCGVIAPLHLKALSCDRRIATVLLYDQQRSRAEKLSQTAINKVEPLAAIELVDDLANALVRADLAHICTPHHAHAELFVRALRAHCSVLCEKPLTTNPDDLRLMQKEAGLAQARGCWSTCIFQHRFGDVFQRLVSGLQQGRWGALRSAAAYGRCTRLASYYAADHWRGTWQGEGGGVLINQMIHCLDLLIQCTGPVATVQSASVGNALLREAAEVEDWVQADLLVGNDVPVRIDFANDQQTKWLNRIELITDQGSLVFSPDQGGHILSESTHPQAALIQEQATAQQSHVQAVGAAVKGEYGNLHMRQIGIWLDGIERQRDPEVSIASAAHTNEVVLACYQSARIGQPVPVDGQLASYAPPNLGACKG